MPKTIKPKVISTIHPLEVLHEITNPKGAPVLWEMFDLWVINLDEKTFVRTLEAMPIEHCESDAQAAMVSGKNLFAFITTSIGVDESRKFVDGLRIASSFIEKRMNQVTK